MGNVILGSLHSLGWFGRSLSRDISLAVARCVGCCARRRVGYDPSAGIYISFIANSHLVDLSFQTLSRLHVCATLAFAQVIGSICVMIARATAPNRIGPESVFPDASKWDFSEGIKGLTFFLTFSFVTHRCSGSPFVYPAFWIALICQLIIVWGYFWFYRKEQLCQSFLVEKIYLESDIVSQHVLKGLDSSFGFDLGLSQKKRTHRLMTGSYGHVIYGSTKVLDYHCLSLCIMSLLHGQNTLISLMLIFFLRV